VPRAELRIAEIVETSCKRNQPRFEMIDRPEFGTWIRAARKVYLRDAIVARNEADAMIAASRAKVEIAVAEATEARSNETRAKAEAQAAREFKSKVEARKAQSNAPGTRASGQGALQ
jgi:hypothetical protein